MDEKTLQRKLLCECNVIKKRPPYRFFGGYI